MNSPFPRPGKGAQDAPSAPPIGITRTAIPVPPP
ncbi:hypothetical protein C1703_32740 [Streptomyces sp. Go-475]|nr:hypothetical protein C1703_32740 [Streptomyces sp. Go-475]